MDKTLTLEMLKEMAPHTVIKSGKAFVEDYWDSTKEMLIDYVAVRGGIHDWAIYYAPAGQAPQEQNMQCGDKMHNPKSIKGCVPCDDAALKMYRQ
jgi:hypothetical protein